MTRKSVSNAGASIRARLLALAQRCGERFERLLQAHAIERPLHRLGASGQRDRFSGDEFERFTPCLFGHEPRHRPELGG